MNEPRKDPVIDEIRAVRQKIWEDCGKDMNRLLQHYKEMQKQYADRLITELPTSKNKDASAA